MNQEMKMANKCSSCGQPIPITEPDCPNCGRKRKIPTATDLYWIGSGHIAECERFGDLHRRAVSDHFQLSAAISDGGYAA